MKNKDTVELLKLVTKQNEEKEKRAVELIIANKELILQNEEREKRAAELIIANKELAFQNEEKNKRAAELVLANKELVFQAGEKADRAAELLIANRELTHQNEEKDKRAAELVIAKNLLDSANKEIEAFSYSVSHDLKAPVRHITGFASLLEKKYAVLLPEEGIQYLKNVIFSAEHMGELIDGLLLFSRAGRIEMNQTCLNMKEIVDGLIQPIIEIDKEHRIKFDIANLPSAYGDLEMLKSVWSNLIENAVKFSKNKITAEIQIGFQETMTEITYYIQDNGAGFDMEYSAKLFNVFQRLHSVSEFEGTGIGLATIKRIITKHGGRTKAEGKVGLGATFYFTLLKRKEDISK